MPKTKNLIGVKFGALTVKSCSERKAKDNCKIWLCECECGNSIEVSTKLLNDKSTRSCGCLGRKTKTENYNKLLEKDMVEETQLSKINTSAPLSKYNKSGVRGVSWSRQCGKWRADITFQRRHIVLGVYDKLGDAAKVRRLAEEKYFEPILEKYKKETGA